MTPATNTAPQTFADHFACHSCCRPGTLSKTFRHSQPLHWNVKRARLRPTMRQWLGPRRKRLSHSSLQVSGELQLLGTRSPASGKWICSANPFARWADKTACNVWAMSEGKLDRYVRQAGRRESGRSSRRVFITRRGEVYRSGRRTLLRKCMACNTTDSCCLLAISVSNYGMMCFFPERGLNLSPICPVFHHTVANNFE